MSTQFLFYFTCIVCITMLAPILCYWTFKFNQYKNTIVVRKRYPNMGILILILSILIICIRIPLSILIITPSLLPTTNHMHASIIYIESFINVYLNHAAVTLVALRFWMIFYKINYTYSSSTNAWKTVINPLITTSNWFLRASNKRKYGNVKWMFFHYFFPFYLIYGTLDFFLNLNHKMSILFGLNLSIYQLIDGFYYFLVLVFCIFLYKRTPNWEDHCFVRSEMRLTYLMWCCCLFFYIVATLCFLCLDVVHLSNDYVQSVMTMYLGMIFLFFYGLLLMWYPINRINVKPSALSRMSSPDQIKMVWNAQKLKRMSDMTHDHHINQKQNVRKTKKRTMSEPTSPSPTNKTSKHHQNQSKDDEILTILRTQSMQNKFVKSDFHIIDDLNTVISDVLSDSILFDRFMDYLSRSFSTESLLSFIEFYHFKQFILLQFENEIDCDENSLFVQRIKHKTNKHKNSKKQRAKHQNMYSQEAVTHNVVLPDNVPKSYLVFGDFMVVSLINGKSVKNTMKKIETKTSKFGKILYEQEKQRKLSELSKNIESSKSKSEVLSVGSLHRSDSKSKSKSSFLQKGKFKKTNLRSSTARKLSTTVVSHTDSVRLQIPDSSQYVAQDTIYSVTEKDVYDDGKVGTPSIISQTIPAESIIPMDSLNISENVEESTTNTYHHQTGGVSVEIDEHLDKNMEISVTPQPSIMSQTNTGITWYNANPSNTMFGRTASLTKTSAEKKHQFKIEAHPQPITPFDRSKQMFGSTTMNPISVSVDNEKQTVTPSPITPNTPPSTVNNHNHTKDGISIRGISFGHGDLSKNIKEAKEKSRIIAHKLYAKYVRIGAELEINISHKTRKKLMDLKIDKLDDWIGQSECDMNVIYHLFDECMEEMFALMRSSIGVFVTSEDYKVIVDKY